MMLFAGCFHYVNASATEKSQVVVGTSLVLVCDNDAVKKNILFNLDVKDGFIPLSMMGFPRSETYIQSKVIEATQALGFYHPQISIDEEERGGGLHIKVILGAVMHWQDVHLEVVGKGASDPVMITKIKQLPIKQGESVNHGVYQSFKQKLLNYYLESGYFDAQFVVNELRVSPELNLADIYWKLDTGEQYQIQQVQLMGSELSQEFLKRYVFTFVDQAYQQNNIIKTQQALNRSGYFRYATVVQQVDAIHHSVTVIYQLMDIQKYEFKTALGYGTDTGGKAAVTLTNRRFDDYGQHFVWGLETNKVEIKTSLTHITPLEGKNNDWVNRFSYQVKDDLLARTRTFSTGSVLQLQLNEHWFNQYGVTLAAEEISANTEIQSRLIYAVPNWHLDYISEVEPLTAQTGSHWQFDVRFSDDILSHPDFRFLQLEQRYKSILSISENWRFIFRTQLGYTMMKSDQFDRFMPSNYRYFAGGDVSVRGYDYQVLSPIDSDGIRLGAKHLLTASVETDWRFAENWRWAFFSDTGNAFNDWSHINPSSSVGTGLRWITPVGSLRFDFAQAFDEPNNWRIHITIGADL